MTSQQLLQFISELKAANQDLASSLVNTNFEKLRDVAILQGRAREIQNTLATITRIMSGNEED